MVNLIIKHIAILALFATTPCNAEISTANNQLATKLYSILAENIKGDFIFSPFTLSCGLAMVNSGAAENTADEFQKALEFIQDKEDVAQDYKRILTDFKKLYSTNQLAIRLYITNDSIIKNSYVDTLREHFYEEPMLVDFSETEITSEEINVWTENATESKVVAIVPNGELESRNSVVLVNTLNFKGSWVNQFKSRDTQPSPFYYNQNKSHQIDMMYQRAEVPFAEIEDLDATAIALPYRITPANKKESRFELIILRPNSRIGLDDLESKLATYPFSLIVARFLEKTDLFIYIPKVHIETHGLDFIEGLKSLGLSSVFNNETSNLSGITDAESVSYPLHVSQIFQKVNFTVDESGSDGILSGGTNPPKSHQPPESFRVDRPFIGFVYDQDRHIVVYMFRKTHSK